MSRVPPPSSRPVACLPTDGPQGLDVRPRAGGVAGLGQLLQQHVDELDVEGLVTGHDEVAQAQDGALSHGQPGGAGRVDTGVIFNFLSSVQTGLRGVGVPGALKLGGQGLHQAGVELH